MSLDQRLSILKSIGEDRIEEEHELVSLLANKAQPICYDGFEPSGRMHIAEGVMKALNVRKLISAGCKVKIWVADWLTVLNNKLGGDLEKIKVIGLYMIEIWRALGMNDEGGEIEFLWASEEINKNINEYFQCVLDIAMKNKLGRISRCGHIMGLSEQEELTPAQVFYVCMQCADVFFLEADICQMGMDQREVNLLAREYCDHVKREKKPIILSHHMLPGLLEGQEKMSKSDPSSAIYMDDEEAEVIRKIKKAFCPPTIVHKNPCIEYVKYIIFPWFSEFRIERAAKYGGNKIYKSFEELVFDYESGEMHPGDLKSALAKALNQILQPVRHHFKTDKNASDLLKSVKEMLKASWTGEKKGFRENIELARAVTTGAPINNCMEQVSISHEGNSRMSLDTKIEIMRSIGEECIQEDELQRLLENKSQPICYDGFEPSGRMHVAQGVMKAINVNKMTMVGCKMKIWIADWFAQLNNKMGGDLEKIQVIGKYFTEIWKSIGMSSEGNQVEFIWSSKEISKRAREYWLLVLDIALRNKLPRILRCCQIMGRSEKEELSAGQIFYACMQCADIFFLKADVCQMGMDQRKVNVLAREYCDNTTIMENKPIILSNHMLPGLKEGQEKMSKSDPSSSIYMEDQEDQVNAKINDAFCPPKVVEKNPCLEYIKYIVFPWFHELKIARTADSGGDKTYKSFEELVFDYESGELHPHDLKLALAKALNHILQPVRDHFNTDPEAMLLLKTVKDYQVTR